MRISDWSSDVCSSDLCNLFFLANPEAAQAVTFWRHAGASRKHPIRLARLLGLHTMLRYALGLLTRNDVLNRLRRLKSAKAAFEDMSFGDCAIDRTEERRDGKEGGSRL